MIKNLFLRPFLLGALIAHLFPVALSAQEVSQNNLIEIEIPWARASVGTMRPTVAYVNIRNNSEKIVTVVGVVSNAAGRSSIHQTLISADGVASMKPIEELEIEPGQLLELKPGSYHIMLMDLKTPFVQGNIEQLTLIMGDATERTFNVPVLSIGARSSADK